MSNIKIGIDIDARINQNINSQIDKLEQKFAEVQSAATKTGFGDKIKDDVQSAKAEISQLRDDFKNIYADFKSQKLDTKEFDNFVKSIKSSIEQLNARLSEVENDYKRLETIFKASPNSSAFEKRLDSLQTKINTFTSQTQEAISTLIDFNKMVNQGTEVKVKGDTSELKDKVEQEVTSFSFKKGGIKVPVSLDATQLPKLQKKYNEIINVLQSYADNNPVDVTMRLFPLNTTKAGAKEVTEAVRNVQAQISSLPEGELKTSVSALYDDLEKQYQKAIRLKVDVELSENQHSIRQRIKELNDAVKEEGFTIYPKFNIEDTDAEAISAKLSELQDKITLKVTSGIKSMSDSLTNLFNTTDVNKWSQDFINGLDAIQNKLNTIVPLMNQLTGVSSTDSKKNNLKQSVPDEQDVNILVEFTNAMKALRSSLQAQQNTKLAIDIQPIIDKLDVLKATVAMVHSGIGNLQSTLSNVKNTGGLQVIYETLQKIEQLTSEIGSGNLDLKVNTTPQVNVDEFISTIQEKINQSNVKIRVPISILPESVDKLITEAQFIIDSKLTNGDIGNISYNNDSNENISNSANQITGLNKRVGNLKNKIDSCWEDWYNFAKASNSATNIAADGVDKIISKIGTLNLALRAVSDGIGNIDFSKQITNLDQVFSTFIQSKSNIANIISDMINADIFIQNNNQKGNQALRERGMYFNNETGKFSNPFVYDEHSSFDLYNQIYDGVSKIYDSFMHTHPDQYASMSLGLIDEKTKQISGDILVFYEEYLKGIYTQIVAAQNDVQIFDAKSFFEQEGIAKKFANSNFAQELSNEYNNAINSFFDNVKTVFQFIEDNKISIEDITTNSIGKISGISENVSANFVNDLIKSTYGTTENLIDNLRRYVETENTTNKTLSELFNEFVNNSVLKDINVSNLPYIDETQIQKYINSMSLTFENQIKNDIKTKYQGQYFDKVNSSTLQSLGINGYDTYTKRLSLDQFRNEYGETKTNAIQLNVEPNFDPAEFVGKATKMLSGYSVLVDVEPKQGGKSNQNSTSEQISKLQQEEQQANATANAEQQLNESRGVSETVITTATATIEEYERLESQSNKTSKSLKQALTSSKNQDAGSSVELLASELEKASQQADILNNKIEEQRNKLNNITIKDSSGFNYSSELTQNITEVYSRIDELKTKLNSVQDVQGLEVWKSELRAVNELIKGVNNSIKEEEQAQKDLASAEAKATKEAEKQNNQNARNLTNQTKLLAEFKNWVLRNSAAYKSMGEQIDNVYSKLGSDTQLTASELREVTNEINRIKTAAAESGKVGKTFTEMLTSRFKSLISYLTTFTSFYRVVSYIRSAFSTLKDLDTQLVDLRKTTTMTTSELNDFYKASSDVAKQMGVTTSEIISQASAWSRLNKIGLLYGNI